MNNISKTTIVLSLLLSIAFGINAQTKEVKFPKYIISTKPLLFFDGEYKLSFEKALKDPRHWVGMGLSGFYLPGKSGRTWSTRNTIDYDDWLYSLKGFGVDVTYKYYFLRNFLYVGSDVFYGNYHTKYDGYSFTKIEEDGLIFYEYDKGLVKNKFNKMNVSAYFGVSTPISHKFFIDTYIGIGYSGILSKDKDNMFDSVLGFGYDGLYPVLGARVGMTLGR